MLGTYPPAADTATLYLGVISALMLSTLLALEWLWRLVWAMFEHPARLRSPLTAVRVTLIIFLITMLSRLLPKLVLYAGWDTFSVESRYRVAEWGGYGEIFAVGLFTFAWVFAQLGQPMVQYQLEKRPLPLHLWPTFEQMRRPLKIGAGVFAVAFALTYLR